MSGFSKVVVAALLLLGSIVVTSQHAFASVPEGSVAIEREAADNQRVFAPSTQSSSMVSASTYLGLFVVGLTLAGVLRSRIMMLRRAGVASQPQAGATGPVPRYPAPQTAA